jgi:hypothetical protein
MTKFKADTVDDFLKAAHKKFGGDSAGKTDFDKTTKLWKGRVNNGKLTLSWTFPQITMDYAEVGGGKPDKANKDAIAEVAQLAKQHEEKHKAGYEAAIKDWDPEQVKEDLESKTYKNEKEVNKAVNDALDDLFRKLLKACLDLHKKEGVIVVAHERDGSIDISMDPAGASGCESFS